ncbi:MAG: 3-hydroxyacyl-ACP dehydratase FabZ family protein [Thermoguttaceae bacterium]
MPIQPTQDILDAIPHREPFLFVDEIVEYVPEESRIVCKKTFTPDEFFFRGHYPNFPVVPGVILCEAALQAGAVLLSRLFSERFDQGNQTPLVAKTGSLRFKQMVRPNDTVFLEGRYKNNMGGVYFLDVKVKLDGKTILAFEAACALTDSSALK